MPPKPPVKIGILGDSHSKFFLPCEFFQGRLRMQDTPPWRVVGQAITAASVAGFRRKKSTLLVKTKIEKALPRFQRMVLAFGQVDLELGYYYRRMIKHEDITTENYVPWLLELYEAFLRELAPTSCEVALKGVNLTALTPKKFAARYVSMIVTESQSIREAEAIRMIQPLILTEDEQNSMHLAFNAGLSDIAARLGLRYFDLVKETAAPSDDDAALPVLDDIYRTAKFDHHVADTVQIRRLHYNAIGKAFDLA